MNFAFYISGYAGTFRNILISNLDVLTNTKLVVSDSKKNIDLKSTLKHFCIIIHNTITHSMGELS